MNVQFLTQPFDSGGSVQRVGDILIELLISRNPLFDRVWLVSAFADQDSVVRLSPHIVASRDAGADIHVVVGIDLWSTSVEALRGILELDVDARVFMNTRKGHTFHPKLFLFEASGHRAELLIGSSNLTRGGLFKNYEAVVWISYDLPLEEGALGGVKASLERFLNPSGPTVQPLTETLIQVLVEREDIISAAHRRRPRTPASSREHPPGEKAVPPSPFGAEAIPNAPPLPAEAARRIVRTAERRRRRVPRSERVEPSIRMIAFYLHLNRLQTPSTPGEVRIPLAGRSVDEAFWGWDNEYETEYKQRGRQRREYKTWKPIWRIADADNPDEVYDEEVRIYGYSDRGEFRFYSSRLVAMGADEFDIVRITRCTGEDMAQFQCELARHGSSTHTEWEVYCTQPMPNSDRKYGFELGE